MSNSEKTVEELKDDLINFLEENDISHAELSELGTNKFGIGKGFTPAAISNLIGKKNQSANNPIPKRARKKLIRLQELAEEVKINNEKKALEGPKNDEGKIQYFYNQSWYLYYYKRGQHLEQGIDGIGRAVLTIGPNRDSVKLINDAVSGDPNFGGSFKLHKDMYLHFFLTTEKGQEGYLFINVFIGREHVHELSIGIYSNTNRDSTSFVGGSVILHHISKEDHNNPPKAEAFVEGEDGFDDLPVEIRDFFAKQENNFVEVSHNMLTLRKLATHNKMHRKD